jgi:hypothetical protein
VEFEDAKHDSIFVKRKNRDTPEWAPRFEHGASQVIDWFWLLSDMRQTDQFEQIFGARDITMNGMVVLGRSDDLDIRETKRLRWRQDKVTADSKHISCVTFDQLYEDLSFRREFLTSGGKDGMLSLALEWRDLWKTDVLSHIFGA